MADVLRYTVGGTSVAGTPTNAAVNIRNPANAKENQVVTNQGPGTAFLGQTSAVTPSAGISFPPGSRLECYGNGAALWAIGASTTAPPANLTVEAGIGAQ